MQWDSETQGLAVLYGGLDAPSIPSANVPPSFPGVAAEAPGAALKHPTRSNKHVFFSQ